MKPGAVIVLALHNSEAFAQRVLVSYDRALLPSGRPFIIVAADDGSTDSTLEKWRTLPSAASMRLVVGFPKARSIAEAKNRAVRLARPFFREFPWVLFADDDDEMLPGRALLLDRVADAGQSAAVGNSIYGPTGKLVTGDWAIAYRRIGPGTTVFHHSVMPSQQEFWEEVPKGVHEDLVTFDWLKTLHGVPFCYHDTPPTMSYTPRPGGALQEIADPDCSRSEAFADLLPADAYVRGAGVSSFCTVALGESAAEARLLVASLRKTGNRQPLLIYTDHATWKGELAGVVGPDVLPMFDDEAAWVVGKDQQLFPGFPHIYKGTQLCPGAFLAKIYAIQEAIRRWPNTLYLDADQLVLGRITERFETPFGVAVEYPYSFGRRPPSPPWSQARFGAFNAGMVYAAAGRQMEEALRNWKMNYLETWMRFGTVTQPHGCFVDQSCLELLVTQVPTTSFHPGFNLIPARLWPGADRELGDPEKLEDEWIAQTCHITGKHGLYFRGWPVQTIHCHLRGATWSRYATRFFCRVLEMSADPTHRALLEMIGA
jgi:hypothetical protein